MNNKDESLLNIRFIGDELESKSVPIYELGQTLISVQRIINKAYLFQEHRLESGSTLNDDEQLALSLQISARYKGSDGYELIPFLTDPAVIDLAKAVLTESLKVLGAYTLAKIEIKRAERKEKEANKKLESINAATPKGKKNSPFVLVSAIYNDVTILTDRIDNRSIQRIEFGLPHDFGLEPVIFSQETKEYVKQLKNEPVLGELQDIKGKVVRLDTSKFVAEVRIENGKLVKVSLEPKDFETVRYRADQNTIVTFTGRPILRFGARTQYKEFEAHSITLEKEM